MDRGRDTRPPPGSYGAQAWDIYGSSRPQEEEMTRSELEEAASERTSPEYESENSESSADRRAAAARQVAKLNQIVQVC